MESYKLEKEIWTEKDFDVMGWHDAIVWSIYGNEETYEFFMDLDYIFQWVHPVEPEKYFHFWVAPVTMVFENAHTIDLDITSQLGRIEVADLHMENPRLTPNGKLIQHTYRFNCQEGEISINATGFKMYVRKPPKYGRAQSLSFEERGGISFDRN